MAEVVHGLQVAIGLLGAFSLGVSLFMALEATRLFADRTRWLWRLFFAAKAVVIAYLVSGTLISAWWSHHIATETSAVWRIPVGLLALLVMELSLLLIVSTLRPPPPPNRPPT